jgi:hypothetical protein
MSDNDWLEVQGGLILEDGNSLPDSFYTVSALNNIRAVYTLCDGKIAVKDGGELSREADDQVLTEAPLHYQLLKGHFTGEITVDEDQSIKLVFEDNTLINIKQ